MIELILLIALVGFVVWLVLQIPMPDVFRNVIIGVVAILLILWVLQQLGFHTGIPALRLGK